MFGHPIRSLVPAHHRSFSAEWQQSMADWEKRVAIATRAAQRYNERTHSFPPPSALAHTFVSTRTRAYGTRSESSSASEIAGITGSRNREDGYYGGIDVSFAPTTPKRPGLRALPSHLPVTLPLIPASYAFPTTTETNPPSPPPPRQSTRMRKLPRRFDD